MTWNPQHPDESTPRPAPDEADRERNEARRAELRDGRAAARLGDAVADDLTRDR